MTLGSKVENPAYLDSLSPAEAIYAKLYGRPICLVMEEKQFRNVSGVLVHRKRAFLIVAVIRRASK